MPGKDVPPPSLGDIAYNLRLSPDQRFALFIGWRTFDNLPPIESDEQYEAYTAEEERARTEHWDSGKTTFGDYTNSSLGRYAAALAFRMIEWEMRLAGTDEK